MSVTYDRAVVFSVYSGFLHQWNWMPRYNWNIVESGIKHHKPNHTKPSSHLRFKMVQQKGEKLFQLWVWVVSLYKESALLPNASQNNTVMYLLIKVYLNYVTTWKFLPSLIKIILKLFWKMLFSVGLISQRQFLYKFGKTCLLRSLTYIKAVPVYMIFDYHSKTN